MAKAKRKALARIPLAHRQCDCGQAEECGRHCPMMIQFLTKTEQLAVAGSRPRKVAKQGHSNTLLKRGVGEAGYPMLMAHPLIGDIRDAFGNPSKVIEFDGPQEAFCEGKRYETLTSVGIKPEGGNYSASGEKTKKAAFAKYDERLSAYKTGANSLAWRVRPVAEKLNGRWFIYSRLAVFP